MVQKDSQMKPSLDATKTAALWEQGKWEDLTAIPMEALEGLSARADLSIFVAAAHFHFGNQIKTRAFVRQALSWGCDKQMINQVLFAGMENTFGCMSAAMGDKKTASRHFAASLSPILSGASAENASFVRRIREMARMGLLSDAAEILGAEISIESQNHSAEKSWISTLETSIEELSHELSLSLHREQLGDPQEKESAEDDPAAYAKARSVSQLGQDTWVLENTDYKKNGYFVEFGATNGILLSNTFLLEAGFGWKGICAEPNPYFFNQLKENRQCITSPACISGETGREVEFIMADVFGGFAEYANDDMHGEKRSAYVDQGKVQTLPTISLHDFLKENKAPKKIDYLSIDTEGSEYEILSNFPFEKWDIQLLSIEHNFTPLREKIHELLVKNGYERIKVEWDDWYKLKPVKKKRSVKPKPKV